MRSKPDPVDQPEITAHYDCAMCIAKILHNTRHRDSSVDIPLPPDQHHCSDEAKWRIGGEHENLNTRLLGMGREQI